MAALATPGSRLAKWSLSASSAEKSVCGEGAAVTDDTSVKEDWARNIAETHITGNGESSKANCKVELPVVICNGANRTNKDHEIN